MFSPSWSKLPVRPFLPNASWSTLSVPHFLPDSIVLECSKQITGTRASLCHIGVVWRENRGYLDWSRTRWDTPELTETENRCVWAWPDWGAGNDINNNLNTNEVFWSLIWRRLITQSFSTQTSLAPPYLNISDPDFNPNSKTSAAFRLFVFVDTKLEDNKPKRLQHPRALYVSPNQSSCLSVFFFIKAGFPAALWARLNNLIITAGGRSGETTSWSSQRFWALKADPHLF